MVKLPKFQQLTPDHEKLILCIAIVLVLFPIDQKQHFYTVEFICEQVINAMKVFSIQVAEFSVSLLHLAFQLQRL